MNPTSKQGALKFQLPRPSTCTDSSADYGIQGELKPSVQLRCTDIVQLGTHPQQYNGTTASASLLLARIMQSVALADINASVRCSRVLIDV